MSQTVKMLLFLNGVEGIVDALRALLSRHLGLFLCFPILFSLALFDLSGCTWDEIVNAGWKGMSIIYAQTWIFPSSKAMHFS